MARTVAVLPAGARITDYISLGVITRTFPLTTVRAVLAASGKASLRERDLPAHVVMYYVIALALSLQASYREVLRCLLEGLQWLRDPAAPLKVAGKSGQDFMGSYTNPSPPACGGRGRGPIAQQWGG